MENQHELSARWQKVALLLAALYKHGVPPERTARLGRQQFRLVASVAGVPAPSDETIALLRGTLRGIKPPVQAERGT